MTSGHTFSRKCSCAAMASVDSPRAVERATPAKRPRDGGGQPGASICARCSSPHQLPGGAQGAPAGCQQRDA